MSTTSQKIMKIFDISISFINPSTFGFGQLFEINLFYKSHLMIIKWIQMLIRVSRQDMIKLGFYIVNINPY